MIGRNPNKDYRQQASITGGKVNTYEVNPGPIGGVNMYKTKDGRRQFQHEASTWVEREPGKFYKSTGNGVLTVSDYNPNPTPPPAPAPRPSGGGGGGGGSSSRPSGYGSTNPYAGSTGSPGLDSSTMALMEMVRSLTETLNTQKTIGDAERSEISRPPGAGLSGTILSNSYIPSSERKKKSYLTPISVT